MSTATEFNVLGTALKFCCTKPVTGYFKDGLCRTTQEDSGAHILCAVLTQEFLEFTKSRGNDLSTPITYWNYPGLSSGSRWCLCISRWLEAEREGLAPYVILELKHRKALKYTTLEILKKYQLIL